MRKVIYFFAFLFIGLNLLNSQNLVSELSIQWIKDNNIQIKGIDLIPYLQIKFINNTGRNIYFKNPLSNVKRGMPNSENDYLSNGILFSIDNNIKSFESFKDSITENYIVKIIGNEEYIDGLIILDDKVKLHNEFELPLINEKIDLVYKIIKTQIRLNDLNKKSQLIFFNYINKNYISIKEAINIVESTKIKHFPKYEFSKKDFNNSKSLIKSNKFCFLKINEEHIEKINLIGFLILGGNYRFELGQEILNDFVFGGSSWNENKKIWIRKKIELPSKLNEFKLYKGLVKTNKVSVSFN